jgi:hypothetical protein
MSTVMGASRRLMLQKAEAAILLDIGGSLCYAQCEV